ncbi:MAG: 2-amino-4-hydroxy-6-hydroxymethyldihydropteridine diphosphokinase [Magnetococcales bacterium]|nr:2-amino-4-hydroxy-6-hydroxymethyldihydropteridine diphosphokinase [Magnetococcales bacterium]
MNNGPILIAFGSNIAPERHLVDGLTRLHAVTGWQAISTVYRTKAIPVPGGPDTHDPDFFNGAVLLDGGWEPLELRVLLKTIERATGRHPDAPRWAPRSLDLDIALMGDRVVRSADLTLPDPDILTRPFLAVTLAQLLPEWRHPEERVTLEVIAARFAPRQREMIAEPGITARLRAIAA